MGYLNHIHNFIGIGHMKTVAEEDRKTRWSGLLLYVEKKIFLHEEKKEFFSERTKRTEYQGVKNHLGDS